MKTNKQPATPKSSFVSGLVAAGALVVFFIMIGLGPTSGMEALAMFYFSAFICLPFILIFGISSLITGRRIESSESFKWWLIPAGVTMVIVIGGPVLMFLWIELTS